VSGAYRLVVHAHGSEPVAVTEPVEPTFSVDDLIPPRE